MKRRDNPFETTEKIKWTDIPTGIFYTIALISIGLALAINLRPLYYLCIKWFNIERLSGLNALVIRENYNALIDYCSPFYTGPLKFPTLRASESGLSHFAEVKDLFNAIYIAGAVSLLLCVISFLIKSHNNEVKYLRNCGIISIVLPAIVGIWSLIDFNSFFIIFHRLAFDNEDWLFDPRTDPVINILPEEFFGVCAGVIVVTVLLGAAVMFILYASCSKKKKEQRLLPRKTNYYY